MVDLASRVRFAESQIRTKDGHPFTFEGRDWQLEEFWQPADGFKFWPRDDDRAAELCDECRPLVNTITEWIDYAERPQDRHQDNCPGLVIEPVILTVINVPRQEGKTFGTAGYCLSQVYQESFRSILYAASSGEQAEVLFAENFKAPITLNPRLLKGARMVGRKVTVKNTRSTIEHVYTSHGSITGRGRTHVILDECRDIAARVAMAVLPSIFAQNGVTCPDGHVRRPLPLGFRLDAPEEICPFPGCERKLRAWYGRAIFMSTSGIVEDNPEFSWFAELVALLESAPDRNAHLYRVEESTNPRKGEGQAADLMGRLFSELPSTKAYVEAELFNRSRRKGEDFLTSQEIARAFDRKQTSRLGDVRPCLGFLDTSEVTDLTSLVLVAADGPDDDLWSRLAQVRLDVWDPAAQPSHMVDAQTVLPTLAQVLPGFLQLEGLWVDTRLQPWAQRMIRDVKKQRAAYPWGRRLKSWEGKRADRDAAYSALEHHIVGQTLALIPDERTRAELEAARTVTRADGSREVREHSRRHRHLDIVDGLAHCCLFAHQMRLRQQQSGARMQRGSRRIDRIIGGLYRPATSRLGPDDL